MKTSNAPTSDNIQGNTKAKVAIVTVVKPKGDTGIKIRRMRVIFKFVSKMLGVKYFEDDIVFQMIAPDERCDVLWFRDNVFRYVDIDCSDVTLVDTRADKLVETCSMKDLEGSHKASIDIIKYYVQDMYMDMSIWRQNNEQ